MNAGPTEATAAVIREADATFEAMLEVLHGQSRRAGSRTASYVMAAAAAAEGRNAVVTSPSAASLTPVALPRLLVPGPEAGVTAVADAVAVVADALADRLAGAAAGARDAGDRHALEIAAVAAAEVRACLTGTG